MLKSFYPQIDWAKIEYVGFDLDGTLYDEFDFIVQAYRPVARRIACETGQNEEYLYQKLTQRWLEKGSSYPHIFSEALKDSGLNEAVAKSIINECIDDFRACEPVLMLPARTSMLLEFANSRYKMFIVTDGGCDLQLRKIKALGLARWFGLQQVAISGCYQDKRQKPSPSMIEVLDCASSLRSNPGAVVFFGDREVDRDFAANAGFIFVFVRNIDPIL